MINALVIVFTLIGLNRILFNSQGVKKSLTWMVYGLILGYRTFEVLPGISFHPIEVFVYATIMRIVLFKIKNYSSFPISYKLLTSIFISFILIDLFDSFDLYSLSEFKNAFLLILILFITNHIYVDNEYIIKIFRHYSIAVSVIAFLGIIEFVFPDLMSNIFGFSGNNRPSTDIIFFNRLSFLFWGSHLAANLIPPFFPITLFLFIKNRSLVSSKTLITFLVVINLFAVYLSGNRVTWLYLTIFIVYTIIFFNDQVVPKIKKYMILLSLSFIIYVYSQPVEGRYISTFKAIAGKIDNRYDSSGSQRLMFIQLALEGIKNNPIGVGWGYKFWVHSDLIQLSLKTGVVSGFLFFYILIILLKKNLTYYSRQKGEVIYFCFTCLMIFVILSLGVNGNISLVQCGVPMFLFISLIESYHLNKKNQKY